MSERRPRRTRPASAAITRRRFVSMLAAGSAALAASGALAADTKSTKPAAKPAAKPATPKPDAVKPSPAAQQKEFDRQRKGTLETLEVLRKFPLPPGGDLPVVFRPMRPTRSKER